MLSSSEQARGAKPRLQVAQPLPVPGDAAGGDAAAADGAQGIVEAGFVVEQVEADLVEVAAVVVLLVDFGDEEQRRVVGLDGRDQLAQRLGGHELHHVAAEAVHAARCPVAQDVEHLGARLGCGPVVLAGVGPVAVAPVEMADGAFVVGGDVVGNVVDQYAQARLVRPGDERVELLEAPRGVVGEVGVDVVPVADGVGRSGVALDEGFAGGVARDAGIPDVVHAQRPQVRELRLSPVGEASLAPQPGQRLVDNRFRQWAIMAPTRPRIA